MTVAGSLTLSPSAHKTGANSVLARKTISLAWTSDAAGVVTQDTAYPISGEIDRVVFVPASGGNAPDNNYDVTLTDENGVDVLAGQGANHSATVAQHVCPGVPLKDGTTTSVVKVVVDGILTLNVTNAGNAKQGSLIIHLH